jgi:hypothetical protein
MIGDSMAPTLRPGDLAGIVPVDGWAGNGVYAFEQLGRPVLRRAEHIHGTDRIRVFYDNSAYTGGEITAEQFNASVLGKVFTFCTVTEGALLQLLRPIVRAGAEHGGRRPGDDL